MNLKILPGLALILALASCAGELTPEEYLARAQSSIDSGDLQEALLDLKNAANKAPNSLEARRQLAYVSLELGLAAGAEKEARQAAKLGLPANEAALLLARSLYMQGDYEGLLAEPDEFAGEPDPAIQSEILVYRARALLEIKDYALARTLTDIALELRPDSASAMATMASYHAMTGNMAEARRWVDRALEADASSADAWGLLGNLKASQGDTEGALEAFGKAIEIRGYPSIINARRAMVLLGLKNYAEADADIALLEAAGLGKAPAVLRVKGMSAYMQQDYAGAADLFEEFLQASPDDLSIKAYLAASLMELNRSERARQLLGQLYAAAPDSPVVGRMRAFLKVQDADLTGARETLSAVLEKSGGKDVTALALLGAVSEIEGEWDAAVDYYQRLLQIEPDNDRAEAALLRARALKGDLIAQYLAAANEPVPEDRYAEALMSAGSALKKGQLNDAMTIAQNLNRQYPRRVGPLQLIAAAQLYSGDLPAGRDTLEQVLEIDPLEPSSVKNLAKTYRAMGQEPQAKRLLEAYLKEKPDDSAARDILSQLIVSSTDAAQAAKALEQELAADPDNPPVRARLVKVLFDQGEYERVLSLTENLDDKSIRAQPVLMELRGKALVNTGQAAGAMENWQKWLEVSPDSVLANYYYSDALMAAGRIEEALPALRKSLELNSRYLPARMAEIRVTALQGDLPAARELMDKLQSELVVERAEVYFLQGRLAIREQDYARAQTALTRSLELEPAGETVLLLAVNLGTLGRQREAVELLETWSPKYADDLRLVATLAQLHMAAGDRQAAMATYERMLEQAPDSKLALNNLAWLKREEDLGEALGYAERAYKLGPEDPIILDTYGKLLATEGQLDLAEKMSAEAVRLSPANIRYKFNYGKILLAQGRNEEAVAVLTEVVQSPVNAELAAEARRLLAAMDEG